MTTAASPLLNRLLVGALGALFIGVLSPSSAVLAQQGPPTPPPEYGPMSISMEDVEYPYPVDYMPLRRYGKDLRMAYMDVEPVGVPNGKTVVLLHGLNFFGEYWGGTMEVLSEEGFRVIAIDQIGFGRSSKPILPYSLVQHAANTRELLEHLDVSHAAIVGHSFGGMLATRFALIYPEITTHLALVNQIGMTDQRLSRGWRDTEEVYQGNLARDYDAIRANIERYYVEWRPEFERHVEIHYGWIRSSDWPRLARIRASNIQAIYTEPVVYDWPLIEARTLVIGGEEDGPNFPELAETVAESVPNAELVLFPDVGHNPHLEAPDIFHPELVRFLETDPMPGFGGGRDH